MKAEPRFWWKMSPPETAGQGDNAGKITPTCELLQGSARAGEVPSLPGRAAVCRGEKVVNMKN